MQNNRNELRGIDMGVIRIIKKENIEALIDKAYFLENEFSSVLQQIALKAQQYSSVELHGDFVSGDGVVISWDDENYNHNVIPVNLFFEKAKKQKHLFTEDELRFMCI